MAALVKDGYAEEWERELELDAMHPDGPRERFGRCYHCEDYNDHENCIGVPCECGCPTIEQRTDAAKVTAALQKLTPEERLILGVSFKE